ncbi:ASCH domain-containing protein [Actinoplanes flavus]|uniref:ASCH domain-containing protein n=1 Tax=Actinoplanes flavus TaxID=2820290 RepID=A0ABS3UEA7_9ACTN|nr:ASCH domain-containing protein [Actinoplanes flavus]MBO3736561.1 ASCH domain-containing protein [Actinoplanes flavus]
MTAQRTLLLSLRPRFAAAILAGTKTIEIRRRPVNASPGTPIILYASSPQMAVVGTARLGSVTVCPPDDGWQRFHDEFGLDREEYDSYLDGAANAHLLHVTAVNRLNEPLPLRHLREQAPFQPPQSFRYVAAGDPAGLRDLVNS